LKSKQRDLIVIIPAHEEEASVGEVVTRVCKLGFPVVVIDDASSDGTAKAAEAAGALVITLNNRLGAWMAAQTGLHYAYERGFKIAVTLDADGQHAPEAIEILLRPLYAREADVVIGSCLSRLSSCRRFAGYFFRKLTGLAIQDITSGFRAYNHMALAALIRKEASLLDYQDLGVLLHLHHAGFVIREVSVPMNPRRNGKSRIFSSWWEVVRYLVATGILGLAKRT